MLASIGFIFEISKVKGFLPILVQLKVHLANITFIFVHFNLIKTYCDDVVLVDVRNSCEVYLGMGEIRTTDTS